MKKSIFLFFAAILCAMTANAQLYLRGGFNDWGTSHQFVSNVCEIELAANTTYEFKIATSNWSSEYGFAAFTATGTKTSNGKGNTSITTGLPGVYRFEFVESTKKLTVTYPELPAPHDITVRAKLPATWTSSTISAWVWTSEDSNATAVTAEKDGDYYKITKNAGALYLIFRNGADWNGDKNQTVDLCYTEDVCLQLNQSGTAKATATVIDCGAVAKDITIKAVVPGAWEETITAWVWPTGGDGKVVTATKNGNWYEITENCIELNAIFRNGTDWNGNENQTVDIKGVTENICYQISALNKVDGKCSVTEVDCDDVIEPEAKPEPTPTYEYYITGSFNGWNEKDPAHGMTLDGEVYKATVTLDAGENLVKVTNGTWTDAKGYSAMGAEYDEVSAGASDDNIMVTLAAGKDVVVVYNATTKKVTFEGLTEKAPSPTFDYYITGSFNSNNPKKAENGMTLDGEVYKATVTLAEGDNTLKVTDGTWDNTWGANELGAAYEEVSNPNDYNNIKITLAAEKEITVVFDATAGKITFEGLTPYVAPLTYTVTVPAGTEKCYIAGPKNDWSFQEMTATANENEFTITIAGAKETDEYKYACQADWAYAEVIEGGGNRTQWTALDNVTAWNKPVVYTYYLMGVNGDWTTGIEMEVNTDAENEVMLTCQPVNGEVKIKRLGDDASESWYGAHSLKAEEGNLGTNADAEGGDGNIALAEGIYNFYFNTADGKLWIAAATDCVTEPTEETIELYDFAWEISDGSLIMSADWNETPVFVEIYNAGETLESGTYNAFLNLGGWADASIDVAEASVELFIWASGAGADMTGTFVGETTGTKYNLSLTGTMPSGGGEAQEYTVEAADLTAIITDGGLSMQDNDGLQVLVSGFDATSETGAYEFEMVTNDFFASGEINVNVAGSVVTLFGDVTGWDWNDNEVLVHVYISGTILDPTAALPVEVTNLQVTTDADAKIAMLQGTGVHQILGQLSFALMLSNYTGEDGEYQLSDESIVSYLRGWMPVEAAPTGSLTKSYSDELGTDVYSGNISFTTADGEYNILLTMYYVAPTAIDVTVNNATITWSGNNLKVTAQWGTYPVALTLYSYEAGAEIYSLDIEIGDFDSDDNWYGMLYLDFNYPLTVTESDNVLTIAGYFRHMMTDELHKVTISGTMPQTVTEITLTEGDNSSALATTGVVTVTVEREFEKDHLYTIALPFTINNAASVFGNGTVVYNFANLAYDKTNEEYILGFTKVNKIEAGKPYLIEPGQDVDGFVAENVTLSGATSISQKVKVDNVEKTATMTAVLSETTTGGSYWLAEDRYLYNGVVDMPALRALFVLPTTPSGMPARARVALKEDAATGVEDLFTTDAPVKVIVNGQLIIIRDGEMYNVQGQLVK